jgi:hypothetical protein
VVKLFGHIAEMTSFSSRITDRRAALRTLLESFGCVVVTSAKTASGTVAGTHDAPRGDAVFEDNPSLWAMKDGPDGEHVPAPEHVLAYFEAFPNDGADEHSYDYDIWIERARAAKFALGPEREKYYPAWEAWMLQWADNTKEIALQKWDSFNNSELGWNYLQHPPEIDFDDNPVVPEIPCPVATAEANARERMFSTSVYVRAVNQFGNLETGDLESPQLPTFHQPSVNRADGMFRLVARSDSFARRGSGSRLGRNESWRLTGGQRNPGRQPSLNRAVKRSPVRHATPGERHDIHAWHGRDGLRDFQEHGSACDPVASHLGQQERRRRLVDRGERAFQGVPAGTQRRGRCHRT